MSNLQEEKVVARIVIEVLEDGKLKVNGPLDNPMLFTDIMTQAMSTMLGRLKSKHKEESQKRIITLPKVGRN